MSTGSAAPGVASSVIPVGYQPAGQWRRPASGRRATVVPARLVGNRQIDPTLGDRQPDAGVPRGFLQRRIEHHDRIRAVREPPQQPFAVFPVPTVSTILRPRRLHFTAMPSASFAFIGLMYAST